MHGLPSSQSVRAPATQAPATHWSFTLQRDPSSQGVPLGTGSVVHAPLAGSQLPASWHASGAVQTTGSPPRQAPASHVSRRVQSSPSLQRLPSGWVGFEQVPVCGSHVPAS